MIGICRNAHYQLASHFSPFTPQSLFPLIPPPTSQNDIFIHTLGFLVQKGPSSRQKAAREETLDTSEGTVDKPYISHGRPNRQSGEKTGRGRGK